MEERPFRAAKIPFNSCRPERRPKEQRDLGQVERSRQSILEDTASGNSHKNIPCLNAALQSKLYTPMPAASQPSAHFHDLRNLRFRFSWLLPAAQLLLCAAFLWPIRLLIVHELHIPLPSIIEQTMVADCQRWSPKQEFFLSSVVALDIPGGLIQLPYAMNTPTRREWSPKGMNDLVWRAVTWPFLCIPFWWIAGRAIDALNAEKHRVLASRISLMEAVIGSIWVTIGALMFIGFLVAAGIKKDLDSIRIAAAGGLWTLLGALSLIARFRQKRLQEKQHATATAATA